MKKSGLFSVTIREFGRETDLERVLNIFSSYKKANTCIEELYGVIRKQLEEKKDIVDWTIDISQSECNKSIVVSYKKKDYELGYWGACREYGILLRIRNLSQAINRNKKYEISL